MACGSCQKKRKQQQQEQKNNNLVYAPRPSSNNSGNAKPASPKFQSPIVLPNPK